MPLISEFSKVVVTGAIDKGWSDEKWTLRGVSSNICIFLGLRIPGEASF